MTQVESTSIKNEIHQIGNANNRGFLGNFGGASCIHEFKAGKYEEGKKCY